MLKTRPSSVFLGSSGKRIGRAQQLLSNIDTPDPVRNLLIFDALLDEARRLGIIPRKNPLEELETAKKIARVISSVH